MSDPKNLTRLKILKWTTPDIRGIMSLTVDSVKAHFNNVVSKESESTMTKDEALKVLHECNRAVIGAQDAEEIANAFGQTLKGLGIGGIKNSQHYRLNYRQDEANLETIAVYDLATELAEKLTGERPSSGMYGRGSYAEDMTEQSIKLLEKAPALTEA